MNKEETNDFLLKNNGDCVNLHCYDCYYYSDTYSKPLSTRCKIYEHHNVEPLSAPDFFHINDKLKMQIILKSRYKQMAEILFHINDKLKMQIILKSRYKQMAEILK